MCSLLCLVQIILCSSSNYIFLMLQIILQHLFQIQDLRLHASMIRNKGKHDHAKSILQLCMLIEQVQDNVRIGILTEINTDTHSFTAGMIVQVCDTIDFFIADKLCNLGNKTSFIYEVRKLRNYNT